MGVLFLGGDEAWTRRFGRDALYLLHLAVSAAAFVAYVTAFRHQGFLLFGMICWYCGRFVSCVVHEAGHAIAALARGWRVVVFAARPFGFQIPNRNPVILGREHHGEGAGWVATVPRSPGMDTGANWSIILAAGAVASLLLELLALQGWASFLRPFDGGEVLVSRIGLGLALQAFHHCIFAMLPAFTDKPTDGDQLRRLDRPEGAYALDRPIKWIGTLLYSRVRLRDLPQWLVEQARTMAPISEESARYVATIGVGQALDSDPVDVERARLLIDEFRARFGSDPWLACCDAYHAAIWEGDSARALAAFSGEQSDPPPTPLYFAAQAATAARMGNTALAIILLKEMDSALKRESPFRDDTFRDIRRQVEAVIA